MLAGSRKDVQKVLTGFIALTMVIGLVSPAYAATSDSGFCRTAEQNLDKLSSSGYMQYLVACTNIIEESGLGQDPLANFANLFSLQPSTIVSVDPNTQINADPATPPGTPWTQSEVSIDSCGDDVVAGYNDSQGFLATGSFSGFSNSQDNGVTWTDGGAIPTNLGELNGGDPSVKADSNCDFYYATLVVQPTASAIGVAKSVDGGQTFSTPVIVESSTVDFLDKEYIGIGPNPAGGQDIIHITYTRFSIDTTIVYERSLDGGVTWQDQFTLNPGGISQGSIPVADPVTGDVYVFYQDFASGTMKVFKNTNGGALGFWSAGVDVDSVGLIFNFADCDQDGVIDRRVWNGDHRANEFPTAAVSPANGEVYVAWNNSPTGSTTDIVFYSSADGGSTWTGPIVPHPPFPTSDQFEPWMDVAPDGEIKMIWYDRRNDANNLLSDVYASSSNDGGLSWQPNVKVTTTSFSMGTLIPYPDPIVTNCYFVGEYIGLDVPNTVFAHAAWGDGRVLSAGQPQPDVFYATLRQAVEGVVGGEILSLDMTSLLIRGVLVNAFWILPTLGGIAVAVIALFNVKRKNHILD